MSEKYPIQTTIGKIEVRVTKNGGIMVFLPGSCQWRLRSFFNAHNQTNHPLIGSNATFEVS